jgi:Cd2+/Zn2+-exporting ATPase
MPVEKLEFKIDGMDCAEEVTVLKKELGPIVGGDERLSFDLLHAKLTVSIGSVVVCHRGRHGGIIARDLQ